MIDKYKLLKKLYGLEQLACINCAFCVKVEYATTCDNFSDQHIHDSENKIHVCAGFKYNENYNIIR